MSTYGQSMADQFLDMKHSLEPERVRIERTGPTAWMLETSQSLALPRDEVFPFFADAANLERITPPQLRFQIMTPTPIAMRAGAIIDYRIHLFGFPMYWRTLIAEWKPPFEFVDVQARGPYAEWVHRHRFVPTADGGTLVEDQVRFRLPLSYLGLAGIPVVKHQLRGIFSYRHRAIEQLLPQPAPR